MSIPAPQFPCRMTDDDQAAIRKVVEARQDLPDKSGPWGRINLRRDAITEAGTQALGRKVSLRRIIDTLMALEPDPLCVAESTADYNELEDATLSDKMQR